MVEFAVLADPFWGRLPWLLKRRGGKHSKHRKFGTSRRLRSCAPGLLRADFHDILMEAEACTRSFAPAGSSTGWRPAM